MSLKPPPPLPLLNLIAPALITAKAGKPPRLEILAYSGGIMSLDGYGPVVVELAGLELPESVPALADHQNRLEAVVGSLTPRTVSGRLYAEGTLSTANESGQRVLQLHRDGVQLQASIGAEPTGPYQQIRPGESFSANGRTLTAGPEGVKLFLSTRLREITLCASGADPGTSVTIKAKQLRNGMPNSTDTPDMTPSTDDLKRGLRRIEASAELIGAEQAAELRASFIDGAMSYDALDDQLWDHARNAGQVAKLRASRPLAPEPGYGRAPQASDNERLEAMLASRYLGESVAEKVYSPVALEASRSLRGMSSVDATLAINGISGVTTQSEKVQAALSPSLRASAGFSTISLPVALSNVASKALARMYRDSPATWRSFCKIKSASTFHEQTGVRPSAFGDLEQIGPQGEIKHDDLTREAIYNWQLGTFAKTIRVSRQHIVNDDLGFIQEVVTSMGPAAMRTLSNLVYDTLKAAGSGFFSPGNGNLHTSAVLSITSFAYALQAMRSQTDENGHYIDAQPATLVVSPALEQTAKEILISEYTERTATAEDIDAVRPTGNPLRQSVRLEVEPRLTTAPGTWYLFAQSDANPMTVGFLDGREAPTVEFFGLDSDPNTLGVSWRVFHDFAAALGDFRAAQRNVN